MSDDNASAADVAGGWFVSAVAMGYFIGTHWYLLIGGLTLVLFMAVPGYVMMRLARAERQAA